MTIFIVAALLLALIAIAALLKAKQPTSNVDLAFEARAPLFSSAERSFYGVLEQALGSDYRVLGKVRLGDIVKPAKGLSQKLQTTANNKLRQKHVDFVICNADDLSVIGVVELDDQSHDRKERAERDEFVDQALAGAKIPVVHIAVKSGYVLPEIRSSLAETFKLRIMAAQITSAPPVQSASSAATAQSEEVAPICPKCAAPMVKRQAKNGPHTGKFFWACSTYPNCRQVVAIEGN
jgi:hypothetical protein